MADSDSCYLVDGTVHRAAALAFVLWGATTREQHNFTTGDGGQ
jgi:hypothetical protein